MEYLKLVPVVLEYLVWAYFAWAAAYFLLFALAGLAPLRRMRPSRPDTRKIAVLIPGYREDRVIVEAAADALRQRYDAFEVVVIADSFQPETLLQLASLPIRLIEVALEPRTKARALNYALEQLGPGYDIALVLDADNLMEPGFLQAVNEAFELGETVVQGQRIAKNANTPFAVLDGLSEAINNRIFRHGHRKLGLSAALIGSGMAFDYAYFRKTLAGVQAVGGFDKELELKMLQAGIRIGYLPWARVRDEKVQQASVFAGQRKRWLAAQFVYFGRFAGAGLRELVLRGNLDFADKVYQMACPPRVLHLGVCVLFTLGYLLGWWLLPAGTLALPVGLWAGILLATLLALALAVPRAAYTRNTLRALGRLPLAFALMVGALLRIKGANRSFIHTQHGV